MSDSHHIAGDDSAHEAGIDVRKVIAVGVASLVAFALCTVAALLILGGQERAYEAEGGGPGLPNAIKEGRHEIGIIEQIPFDSDRRLPQWQAAMRKRLHGYGWVDQAKGVAHVPIEKAMQQVVEEAAAKGGAKR